MEAVANIAPVQGLQIRTYGQMVKLTKGQSNLLNAIRGCVANSTALSWEIIVDVYCRSLRSQIPQKKYQPMDDIVDINGKTHWVCGRYRHTGNYYDIRDEFKKDSDIWIK